MTWIAQPAFRLLALILPALLLGISTTPSVAQDSEERNIRLASDPALSPDGQTLVFSWAGDLWSVPTEGGMARRLTSHPARENEPVFSPDGSRIAFTSNRDGGRQVFVMPAEGGLPRQLTHHSEGYSLEGWYPDGNSLLTKATRDHFWRRGQRFFKVSAVERIAETLLFDDYGADGSLSPDGRRLLFTREGVAWWRKGYVGTQDSQIWMFDVESGEFSKVLDPDGGAHWPLWKPDGEGFYYVGVHGGAMNLMEHDLESGEDRALTSFEDDSVVMPCLSADGSTIVFRHLFDFYRIRHGQDDSPAKIEIQHTSDDLVQRDTLRRVLDRATDVAFSKDGLEIAMISGGDLWVMDTELRDPIRVTSTVEEERDPVFGPDGTTLLFVSDKGGQSDLWMARRKDPDAYWWRNSDFELTRVTNDGEVESAPQYSPEGTKLAYRRGAGEIWVADAQGKSAKRVINALSVPSFDWSPDGKWLTYAQVDDDYNTDIWITPTDGSREPFNLSRHPSSESDPTWSPDGRVIAFTSKRAGDEHDIYFVWLRAEDDQIVDRERTLEKALEKMKKARKDAPKSSSNGKPKPKPDDDELAKDDEPAKDDEDSEQPETDKEDAKDKKVAEVVIDFDEIHERIRRISIPDSRESGLLWSPDSKKLAFNASIDDKRGVYVVEIPENMRPKLLTSETGRGARWLKEGDQIVWLSSSGGIPASIAAGRNGAVTTYGFRALQDMDRKARMAAAFDLSWRIMRDRYYDERLGNRNWDQVRRKYIDAAADAVDTENFATVVNLMLGELNGSHLGFRASSSGGGSSDDDSQWGLTTAHLGLRFETDYKGPGLKVRDVILDGPTSRKAAKVEPGEILMSIDGQPVDPAMDLTLVLNGPSSRDIALTVRNADGEDREIVIRPVSYGFARGKLYDAWIKHNRAMVEEASDGTLGYLHIAGMNFPSFYQFQGDLYAAGAGKEGLIIDVRENGGGSTADHLLTALTQPLHAITVGRGGGPGYPNDRTVYASWNKPIVVLCNQNSFSNAEIFAHAIKTLKRGQLVGVTTAGGVISTGSATVMDLGTLRLPGRGWYLVETGEDMELNGAVPHHLLWLEPGEWPSGEDRQLTKAVEVLLGDVEKVKETPMPKLIKASERPANGREDVVHPDD